MSIAVSALLFSLGFVICAVLTRYWVTLAPRLGFIDRPDRHRKGHRKPTPVGGGIAIFLTMCVVVLFYLWASGLLYPLAAESSAPEFLGLGLSSILIVTIGLVDDRFTISGKLKLLAQIVAGSILIASGFYFDTIGIFGVVVSLGWIAIPVTLFWLLGAVNAMNLLDGLDGMASTIGLIMSLAIGVIALLSGRILVAAAAMTLAGCLTAFLWFNFPPAKVFLGDTGSMLIGWVVGVLAIEGAMKGPSTVMLTVPVAIWTIPIMDAGAAVLRRKMTGRSIYDTDRNHLHHRMMQRLGCNRKTLLWVGAACICTSLGAMMSFNFQMDGIAFAVAAGVLLILVACQMFGNKELALMVHLFRRKVRQLLRRPTGRLGGEAGIESAFAYHLQGDLDWMSVWEELVATAHHMRFARVRLDINVPLLHEEFVGSWEGKENRRGQTQWTASLPLILGDFWVGRLELLGSDSQSETGEALAKVRELLELCQRNIHAMVEVPLQQRDVVLPRPHFAARGTATMTPMGYLASGHAAGRAVEHTLTEAK